jgi:two-component system chemotaxis response regulator CheY
MPKILIVDDEIQLQEIYATFFKNNGFNDVMFASDGLEAHSLCHQYKFDLITLDHQMPYLTGAEFLKALRLKPNQNEKCPVIMISGFIPEIDHSCKSFENTFFLDKPVDFEKLVKYAKMITKKDVHAIAS